MFHETARDPRSDRALRAQAVLPGTAGDEVKVLDPAALGGEDRVLAGALPPARGITEIKADVAERYGVTLNDGDGRWTAAEATRILEQLACVPEWDLGVLRDCWMYREGDLSSPLGRVEANSHYKWNDAKDGENVYGYTDVKHIHFYDAAFDKRVFFEARENFPLLHELGHLRAEATLVRGNRRAFLDGVDRVLALHGEAVAQADRFVPTDADAPKVREFVLRLHGRWTSDYARLREHLESLRRDFDDLWAYTDVFERYGVSRDEMAGWGRVVNGARNACEDLGGWAYGVGKEIDEEIKAYGDLLLAKATFGTPGLRAQCLGFLKVCDMLFAETPKVLRQALAYGGSARYLEYFQWVVRASGFNPFTEYSKVSRAEWFAETYELAALDPGELARLSGPMAEWFVTRRLAFPLHLHPYTADDLLPP
ncbi:hypothetical protein [Streptomyces mirabilis]|uniref:hypothetical protein n=1 Tax=Streptomyces mirabilis TaxID=68239 RepID=UPI003327AB66